MSGLLDELRALALHGVFPPARTDRAVRDAADQIERLTKALETIRDMASVDLEVAPQIAGEALDHD
jgi:hypothetical protein